MKDMKNEIDHVRGGFTLKEVDRKRGINSIMAATVQRPIRRISRLLMPLMAASVVCGLAFFGALWLMQDQQCETFACLLESDIDLISSDDLIEADLYDELWMEAALEDLGGLEEFLDQDYFLAP